MRYAPFAAFMICLIAVAAEPARAQNDPGGGAGFSGVDVDQATEDAAAAASKDSDAVLKDQKTGMDEELQKKKNLRDAANKGKGKHKKPGAASIDKTTGDAGAAASKASEADLKNQMGAMDKEGRKKKDLRDAANKSKVKKSGPGDASQQDNKKLQQLQGNYNKAEKTQSSLMDKSEDTQSSVAKNLK